jgi:hypothetical protein
MIAPVHYGLLLPRWIRLAMPDDVAQEIALAALLGHTEAQRRAALQFRLRELRRTQWERRPCKPAHRPPALRPSKLAGVTGYRQDSARHRTARMTVISETRREIARKGQAAWTATR